MADLFPKIGLSKEEDYRLLFDVELSEKDYHKRPMSKFKHDILKELGILKKLRRCVCQPLHIQHLLKTQRKLSGIG